MKWKGLTWLMVMVTAAFGSEAANLSPPDLKLESKQVTIIDMVIPIVTPPSSLKPRTTLRGDLDGLEIDNINPRETGEDEGEEEGEEDSTPDTTDSSSTTDGSSTTDCSSTTDGSSTTNDSTTDGSTTSGESSTPEEGSSTPSSTTESIAAESEENPEPIIETDRGPVRGFLQHEFDIRSFIDIPYGSFSHPFKAPHKPQRWTETHAVKQHAKRCPQLDDEGRYIGNLDCLTLSVFAPIDAENLPVLFHIYDGQFQLGSADPCLYGPEHIVTKGIILVLPNYRVGPLGFLCMKNELAPGNAGLKDLALAIEWTKTNIASFGGNASSIVVSGDGMAGALAGYLALSPNTKKHVQGVITESGSVLAHWALDRNPELKSEALVDLVTEYMDESDIEDLLIKARDNTFKPCVENGTDAFLDDTPWEILQKEDNKIDISFMMGSANLAGLHEALKETSENMAELDENFSQFLPNDLVFDNSAKKAEVGDKIREIYFNDKSISMDLLQELGLYYTDAYYLGPALRLSRALVKAGAKVFFYEFSFVGDFNRELLSLGSKVTTGAVRGDLVGYTFTQDGIIPEDGTDEDKMIETITDLWISFIKTGIPSTDVVNWYKLEDAKEEEENWLSLKLDTEARMGLHVDRLGAWTEVYRNHFIERNLATKFMPSPIFITATTLIMLSFSKEP